MQCSPQADIEACRVGVVWAEYVTTSLGTHQKLSHTVLSGAGGGRGEHRYQVHNHASIYTIQCGVCTNYHHRGIIAGVVPRNVSV